MKREMDRLQELGKRLTELNASQWQTLTIKEVLLDALAESKRLNTMKLSVAIFSTSASSCVMKM